MDGALFDVRFIPARAGNTRAGSTGSAPPPVHPRSRGEHTSPVATRMYVFGSSPLARGTLKANRADLLAKRFIPARAGNTISRSLQIPGGSVHPRSRGEHLETGQSTQNQSGSSPLARGTLKANRADLLAKRFIPARAGNTTTPATQWGWDSVHPRSRGEHTWEIMSAAASSGSSPLARGTPLRDLPSRSCVRFIPARAGNTRWVSSSVLPRPVHPRSRGEHMNTTPQAIKSAGSSPLARGTPLSITQLSRVTAVHPRSRGEHFG